METVSTSARGCASSSELVVGHLRERSPGRRGPAVSLWLVGVRATIKVRGSETSSKKSCTTSKPTPRR